MNENKTQQNNLLDTTDCLEAVGVFRGWKNVFFVIAILCLLLLQASFWLVDQGFIEVSGPVPCREAIATGAPVPDANVVKAAAEVNQPRQGVGPAVAPAVEPAAKQSKYTKAFLSCVTSKHIFWAIKIANGVLVLTAVLYCLTILFSLKISLVGRLGGINHISRAFFLSLIVVVLLLLGLISFGHIPGAIYTPRELVRRYSAEHGDIPRMTLYYLRFTGYWALVVLLLIFSQIRSSRWTKVVLRRLEVI